MKIVFLGDTHGHFNSIEYAIKRQDADMFIHVGDVGIGFGNTCPGFSKPIFFIDGNHDNHIQLQKAVKDSKLEIAPNLFYIPRASSLNVNGITINCIGGANSIDKHYRVEGKSWWREEIPNHKEMMDFAKLPKADIVVTHTAPIGVLERFNFRNIDPVSTDLESILSTMHNKPKYWVFGHIHEYFEKEYKGIQFICVPCTHDTHDYSLGYSIEI